MTNIVVLENAHWQVGLVPTSGGSVAYARTRVADAWVDVLRPTPEDALADPWATGSFPLVPWSNRLTDGRFSWAGRDHQLRINFADGTAIHGTAIEFPWTVIEQTATSATLEFVSGSFHGVNFPWAFSTRCTYTLDGDRFTWGMELANDDHETFPAGLGHHPYFERSLTADGATVGQPVELQLNCSMAYPNEGCLPTGPAELVEGRLNFTTQRPLGDEFVDDCWTGRTSSVLATLEYPEALTVDIEAGALFEHTVVYIPTGETFFAVEPVTNVNNGFNLEAQGMAGTGVFLLQPGETCSTAFTLISQPHV